MRVKDEKKQTLSTDITALPTSPQSPKSKAASDVDMENTEPAQEEEGGNVKGEQMDGIQSTEPARPATIEPSVNHKTEQIARQVGQMIMVQFLGYEVSREIRMLIEKYYIGGVLLGKANFHDARQVAALTFELQKIAKDAGYRYPLLIGIDQENGMFSSFGDGLRGTHFPGAMTVAATRSPNEAYKIGSATAKELSAVGINWIYGPSLDLVHERDGTGVSVRSFGDHPETVGRFGQAFIEGLKSNGVIACGKHFPGANTGITRDGRRNPSFENRSLEEMETTDLIPFKMALQAGVSCLKLSSSIWLDTPEGISYSKYVVQDLLRQHMGYSGLIVGNYVDMPAYVNHRDVSRAAVDAITTGCDMIMMLNNIDSQVAAIRGITDAVERRMLQEKDISEKFERIQKLKSNNLDWKAALELNPGDIMGMMHEHHVLAKKVHDGAVTIARDDLGLIPVNLKISSQADTVLLITPTVRPLHRPPPGERLMDPFEPLGRALARRHPRIRHVPYTVVGMTPLHQTLIRQAAAVIFVTVNALQSQSQTYQLKMADAVKQACGHKPLISVAACDPYDLLADRNNFGTYVCIYEYSFMALETAAAVIMGERHAPGVLPVTVPGVQSRRQQRQWFVEKWEKRKDLYASLDLWKECLGSERWPMDATTLSQLLDRPGCAAHFVVRNPNPASNELLGIAVTYSISQAYTTTNAVLGSLALLLVRPSHRNLGIGRSLHDVAIRHLQNTPGMANIQLGSIYPRIFPGLPVEMTQQDSMWFMRQGWKFEEKFVFDLFMNIENWEPQERIFAEQAAKGISFSRCAPHQFDALIEFAIKNFGEYPGWVDRYRLLRDTDDIADAIVATAKDGNIVGAALVYTPASNNQMAKDIPWPKMIGERNGGFSCVSVGKEVRGQGLGTALICAAIVELKNRGIKGCFVDWVDLVEYDGTYKSLGFTHWGKYREIWRRIAS